MQNNDAKETLQEHDPCQFCLELIFACLMTNYIRALSWCWQWPPVFEGVTVIMFHDISSFPVWATRSVHQQHQYKCSKSKRKILPSDHSFTRICDLFYFMYTNSTFILCYMKITVGREGTPEDGGSRLLRNAGTRLYSVTSRKTPHS
jgi:hypothetical protein